VLEILYGAKLSASTISRMMKTGSEEVKERVQGYGMRYFKN